MKRFLLLFAAMLACVLPVAAQTVTVSATNVHDIFGNKLASGQACFLPTDNSGNPMSFKDGSGGQVGRIKKCVSVTNGSFSASLPDTALTNPANICYQTTVKDTSNGTTPISSGYECVQPTASNSWCTAGACNFDNYVPATVPNIVQVAGPTGPQGPPGLTFNAASDIPFSGSNTWSGANAPDADDTRSWGSSLNRFIGWFSHLWAKYINGVRFADEFPGADFGAKVAAAIADSPAIGGTVDARNFDNTATCSTEIVISKPVELILPPYFTETGTCRIRVTVGADGVKVHGTMGPPRHLANASDLQGTVIVNNTQAQNAIQIDTSVRGVHMRDFMVSGNRLVSGATAGHGIAIMNDGVSGTDQNFTFENISVENAFGSGWFMQNTTFEIEMKTVSGNKNGVNGLHIEKNVGSVAPGQISCLHCIFDSNVGTDQVYVYGDLELTDGTVSDGVNGVATHTAGYVRSKGQHYEALTGDAVQINTNSGYVNVIDGNYFLLGNNSVVMATGAGAALMLGNTYGSHMTSPPEGFELKTAASTGPVMLLDDMTGKSTSVAAGTVKNRLALGKWVIGSDSGNNTTSIDAIGQNYAVLGGNNFTDSTNKTNCGAGTVPYVNVQTPFCGLLMQTLSTANTVSIGGGSSIGQAATSVNFYTAAAVNTATGTQRWTIDTAGNFKAGTDNSWDIGSSGALRPRTVYAGTAINSPSYQTTTNCSSSAGTCTAAPSGSVSIAAAATTVTVTTTAVTANSQIQVTEDSSLGTRLGVTCNTTAGRVYMVTARTAATSFVITSSAAPTTNPACLSFTIVN